MQKMYLMRGLPGSGKSTFVKSLTSDENCVFSTDNFYIPITIKVKKILKDENENLNEYLSLCQSIFDIWNNSSKFEEKSIHENTYLDFNKSFQKGEYKECLNIFINNSIFEFLEYCGNFSVTKSPIFHKKNFANFQEAIIKKQNLVIVDNTNVSLKEGAKYVKFAHDHNYEIIIQEPVSPHWKKYEFTLKDKKGFYFEEFINILHTKNKHGVPKDVILNMANRWFYKPKIKDFLNHD